MQRCISGTSQHPCLTAVCTRAKRGTVCQAALLAEHLAGAVSAELGGSLAAYELAFGINTVARSDFTHMQQELAAWEPLLMVWPLLLFCCAQITCCAVCPDPCSHACICRRSRGSRRSAAPCWQPWTGWRAGWRRWRVQYTPLMLTAGTWPVS